MGVHRRHVSTDTKRLTSLGQRVDRLVEEFNAGLHASVDKERVLEALVNTASLSAELLALNPTEARKPYFAHQKRMTDFFREVLGSQDK